MPNIFDFKLVFTQIPQLLKYLPITLAITILLMIFGLVIGLILAIIKIKYIPYSILLIKGRLKLHILLE